MVKICWNKVDWDTIVILTSLKNVGIRLILLQ